MLTLGEGGEGYIGTLTIFAIFSKSKISLK